MKITARLFYFILSILFIRAGHAQDIYPLWEGIEKPYYKENSLKEYEKESWGVFCVFDVTDPTLTVYQAEGERNDKAVLIIPGGGYSAVAIYHEGHSIAQAISKQGITAAVLKYRLPNPVSSDQPQWVPLSDARRAMQLLRNMSHIYGIDKSQVAVMGFSAGSHLATVLSLWESDNSVKPDYCALIYGVTNLTEDNLKWLEEDLYYRKLTEKELAMNRLLDFVSENTPPSFLVHAYDDEVCNISESTLYAQKCHENNVPVEMHVFQRGGHGFGMGSKMNGTSQWLGLFLNWLTMQD